MTPFLSFFVLVDLFSCKLGTWHIAPYHPGATSPAPGYFLLPRLNVTWQKKTCSTCSFCFFYFITFWLFVCSDLTWLGQPPLSSWLSTNQSAPSRNCRRCSCSDIHTFCTWAYIVAEGLIFGLCYNWALFGKDSLLLVHLPVPSQDKSGHFEPRSLLGTFQQAAPANQILREKLSSKFYYTFLWVM